MKTFDTIPDKIYFHYLERADLMHAAYYLKDKTRYELAEAMWLKDQEKKET